MKKISYLMMMFALLFMGAVSVNAQVTIGSQNDPHSGSVLDLSQVPGKNLGFLLPQASLGSASSWSPLSGSKTEGMLVYNTGSTLEKGAYVWTVDSENPNGFWSKVTGSGQSPTVDPNLPGTPGTWVTPTNATGSGTSADKYTNVCPATTVVLTAQSGYAFSNISGGTIASNVATFTASGQVTATKDGKTGTIHVTIATCEVTPPVGTFALANGVYEPKYSGSYLSTTVLPDGSNKATTLAQFTATNKTLYIANSNESGTKAWSDAKAACTDKGLRLPTLGELANWHGKSGAPTSDGYWSSTEGSGTHAWRWHFGGSSAGTNFKTTSYYVRCVGE